MILYLKKSLQNPNTTHWDSDSHIPAVEYGQLFYREIIITIHALKKNPKNGESKKKYNVLRRYYMVIQILL